MEAPNWKVQAVTLGLIAVIVFGILFVKHEVVQPPTQTVPSDATCVAYLEADERFREGRRGREEVDRISRANGSATVTEVFATLGGPDPLDRERREAYLQAYRGVASSNRAVMTELLNADRRRCCEKLESRPRCPFRWL